MIRNIIIPITLTIALGTSASACSGGGSVPVEARQDVLFRADAPAPRWVESFPLGNGRIGMMSDGATGRETVVLNEISTWTGSKDDADNPMALDSLGRIRELLFAGRNDEAQELMTRTFVCGGRGTRITEPYNTSFGQYQLFGNLIIDHKEAGEVSGYNRVLDLGSAVETVSYSRGGVKFTRQAFTARGADVGVLRITADKPDAIAFVLSLNRKSNVEMRPEWEPVVKADGCDLVYDVRLHSGQEGSPDVLPQGMKLAGRVRILLPQGGSIEVVNDSLSVQGAGEAIVLAAMNTDYRNPDPDALSLKQIEAAAALPFSSILEAHIADHRKFFDRVSLDLGHNPARESLTLKERLEAYDRDHDDPALVALYYQFGRYLLISTTREGSLPPNLQGMWANTIRTPWTGDYHLNINLQMNYWPAEKGNLPELVMPLVDWTEEQVESGRHTAQAFYGARGWTSHIRANVWEYTAPGDSPSWGATNTCAAWLCEHLYDHWLYTLDKDYLARIYPTMKEAALFFVDMLVEDPETHWLVTAPTTSPENSFLLPNGHKANACAGSTMDNQIVRELFTNTIAAAGILRTDAGFVKELEEKLARIQPTTIGEDGRIMEWLRPYGETDVHHRHVSHLYGLFPGNEISPLRTPELADAARKSLEVRGDESTGWSMAWKICFWARLHDGEHAWKLIGDLLHPAGTGAGTNYSRGGGSHANMFCVHPPFQIDGNFGGAAGIAEMLMQDDGGTIELIPALPDAWKTGSFHGLRAKGGLEVSAAWEDKKITWVQVKADTQAKINIVGLTSRPVKLRSGRTWEYRR